MLETKIRATGRSVSAKNHVVGTEIKNHFAALKLWAITRIKNTALVTSL